MYFSKLCALLKDIVAGSMYLIVEYLGSPLGTILAFYLIFFTRFWWLTLAYLIWIYLIDTRVAEEGGRSIEWFRNLKIWKWSYDYFSSKLVVQEGVELDAKKNYLFACYPHGFINTGPPINFGIYTSGVRKIFPNHIPYICVVKSLLSFPFHRDLVFAMGLLSCSAKSINYLLSYPGGGRIAALMVGGAEEAFYCKPGKYKLVIKNRKGFIKLALRNGSPIVPVFTFGETDIWDQIEFPPESWIRRGQEWCKRNWGYAPIVFLGRGLIQPSIFPRKVKVICCVGKPIDVEKVAEPTQEQIDSLHEKFVEELEKLFETEKHKYLENPEATKLEFV